MVSFDPLSTADFDLSKGNSFLWAPRTTVLWNWKTPEKYFFKEKYLSLKAMELMIFFFTNEEAEAGKCQYLDESDRNGFLAA